VDEIAHFTENITAPTTVTLNSPITLGTIKFNSPQPYTLTGTVDLTLQTSSGNATINVIAGNHLIDVPVVINSDTVISGEGTVDLAKGISSQSGGSWQLTKAGSGTLVLSGNSSYSGDTIVTAGTLEIAGGIGAGGTSLIDVQAGKVILETVNISKADLDISTAATGMFEVLNGTHEIGEITGSGVTLIDAGASLTVTSLCQGRLTVGAGAKLILRSATSAALSGDMTAVPEPFTINLLGISVFVLLAYARRRRKQL
jgi:fibronectin-binding autotransporter adhesin